MANEQTIENTARLIEQLDSEPFSWRKVKAWILLCIFGVFVLEIPAGIILASSRRREKAKRLK